MPSRQLQRPPIFLLSLLLSLLFPQPSAAQGPPAASPAEAGRPPDSGAASSPAGQEPTAPPVAAVSPPPTAAEQTGPNLASAREKGMPTRPLAEVIELRAGSTCLEHARLVDRIARWLEREQVDARIRIRVEGGDAEDEVTFFVRLVDDPGSEEPHAARTIEGAPRDCDQLHAAIALAVALAIDAVLFEARAPAIDLPPQDEQLFEPPTAPYFRFAAGVLGSASSGLLTDVGLGLGLRAEVGFVPWLDLRVGGGISRVSQQAVPGTPGTFDAELFFGRVDACGVASVIERLRLLACGSAQAGAFVTRGMGYPHSFTESKPWTAGAVGLEAQLELMPFLALAIGGELVLPLARRTIRVQLGEESVDRDLIAAGAAINVGLLFRIF